MKKFIIVEKQTGGGLADPRNNKDGAPLLSVHQNSIGIYHPTQLKLNINRGDRILLARADGQWYIAKALEHQRHGYTMHVPDNALTGHIGSKGLVERSIPIGEYVLGDPEFDGKNDWFPLDLQP